jgi:uncharacterized protein YcsI (UPF0317 family)
MDRYTKEELLALTPREYRRMCRSGEWTGETFGVCRGYAQTDLAIIPRKYAYDYLVFCHRNPRALSVVDITDVGSPHPPRLAPDADLRTDLPRYIVYQNGEIIDEPNDILKYWRDDLVGVLLGCSASFDWALRAANVEPRSNGVFSTNVPSVPSGIFYGRIAVSCRLFKNSYEAVRAVQISSRHLIVHGPPMHIGDPAFVGINDMSNPDLIHPYGDVTPRGPLPGEVAMFWPCSATNRLVAVDAKIPVMIVDHFRCMLVIDKRAEEVAIL